MEFEMKPTKRNGVNFDARFFSKEVKKGRQFSAEETFRFIYRHSFWSKGQSISGDGSTVSQTEEIRQQLPFLIKKVGIRSILDIPCGDFHWMKTVEMGSVHYTGADIVDELIRQNNHQYADDSRTFVKLDVIRDPLPMADLVFCRDCFVHLSNGDITKALENIRHSKSVYLLTTTFPACMENEEIVTGDWRIINLQKDPFNLPEPLWLLNEKCTEGEHTYSDKSLGLWKISDL